MSFRPPVPGPESPLQVAEHLAEHLRSGPFAVLTGAGCSTESGIPDYRGPETRRRARSPIRFAQFAADPAARRRYWARALVGYRRFRDRAPNPGHYALAALEQSGHLTGLVTQNVDDLHEQAGSQRVVPLHGSLSRVRCLGCGHTLPRAELQAQLERLNPEHSRLTAVQAPDGDADLPDTLLQDFQIIDCPLCGGLLKPHVVFFGENVPKPRVDDAFEMCDAGRALLVVGSSLMVWSGLRFVRRAAERGQPVAILNIGESRGDPLATVRVEGLSGQVLPELCRLLTGQDPSALLPGRG